MYTSQALISNICAYVSLLAASWLEFLDLDDTLHFSDDELEVFLHTVPQLSTMARPVSASSREIIQAPGKWASPFPSAGSLSCVSSADMSSAAPPFCAQAVGSKAEPSAHCRGHDGRPSAARNEASRYIAGAPAALNGRSTPADASVDCPYIVRQRYVPLPVRLLPGLAVISAERRGECVSAYQRLAHGNGIGTCRRIVDLIAIDRGGASVSGKRRLACVIDSGRKGRLLDIRASCPQSLGCC